MTKRKALLICGLFGAIAFYAFLTMPPESWMYYRGGHLDLDKQCFIGPERCTCLLGSMTKIHWPPSGSCSILEHCMDYKVAICDPAQKLEKKG